MTESNVSDERLAEYAALLPDDEPHADELASMARELQSLRAAAKVRAIREGDGEWVMVPREPTEAMIEAHFQAHAKANTVFADVPSIWAAMIAATPIPATGGEKE